MVSPERALPTDVMPRVCRTPLSIAESLPGISHARISPPRCLWASIGPCPIRPAVYSTRRKGTCHVTSSQHISFIGWPRWRHPSTGAEIRARANPTPCPQSRATDRMLFRVHPLSRTRMPTVAGYASAGTSSESGTDHGYFPGLSTADSMIARPSSSMLTMAKTDVPSGWTFTRSPGFTVVPLRSTRERGRVIFAVQQAILPGPARSSRPGPLVAGQPARRRARSRTAQRPPHACALLGGPPRAWNSTTLLLAGGVGAALSDIHRRRPCRSGGGSVDRGGLSRVAPG